MSGFRIFALLLPATYRANRTLCPVWPLLRQLAVLQFAQFRGGRIRGDAERLRQVDLAGTEADFVIGDVDVDELLVVDPGLDSLVRDPQPQDIPAAGFEDAADARLVL